jgi:hypothetical protein
MPLQPPERPQVDIASAGHWPWGSVPASTAAQVPFAWPVHTPEHAWQRPVQGASQQKPSAQLPEAHWAAAVQGAESGSCAAQVPPPQ